MGEPMKNHSWIVPALFVSILAGYATIMWIMARLVFGGEV